MSRDDPCGHIIGVPWRRAKGSHIRDKVDWSLADDRRNDLWEDVASAVSEQEELVGELPSRLGTQG
eukprot:12962378-Alexandrium_andersonii.AAC.1